MCLNPINRSYVNYLGSRKSAACACGHCLECAQKYQNDWSFRLIAKNRLSQKIFYQSANANRLTNDNEDEKYLDHIHYIERI